jgi:hypothetical protein
MATSKTNVHKITYVPVFYMTLGLHDLMGANTLLRPLEEAGPENLNFFGAKWHLLRSMPFQGPKRYFQGHPFQWHLQCIRPHQNH